MGTIVWVYEVRNNGTCTYAFCYVVQMKEADPFSQPLSFELIY